MRGSPEKKQSIIVAFGGHAYYLINFFIIGFGVDVFHCDDPNISRYKTVLHG